MNNPRSLVLFVFLDFLKGCKVSCRRLRRVERQIRMNSFGMRRCGPVEPLPEAMDNEEILSPTLKYPVFTYQEVVQ